MLGLLLGLHSNPPLKGDALSPFTMVESGGKVYAWKPGRTTVICAFAYWCDTWKTQRERLLESQKKTAGLPVDYLAVSVDGQWQDIDKHAPWSQRLADPGSQWSKSLGIDRVPYTFVVDPSGTVTWTGYGIARSDDISHEVRKSMSEATSTNRTIYLTFDDYPAKTGNAELLDVLRRYQVKAAFFVVGDDAVQAPKWVARASDEGHQLEVHGWHHTATGSDPMKCRNWIQQQIGKLPQWHRNPGSSVIQDFQGKKFPAAEIDPYDFLRPGVGELERRIFGRLRGGAVIHLHAGVQDTIDAMPTVIERVRKLGYEFAPLP